MRIPPLLRYLVPLAVLSACTGGSGTEGTGDGPGTPAAVFPPPDQIVDDRKIVGTTPTTPDKPPPEVDKTPPAVTDIRFVGPQDRPTEIHVVFDREMAKTPPPASAFTSTPPIEGALVWVNDKVLSFRPAKELPLAAKFDLAVSGLPSAAGTPMAAPRTFALNTRRLGLEWSLPTNPNWARRQEPMEAASIAFNMPVALDAIQKAVSFIVSDKLADVVAGNGAPLEATVTLAKEAGWDGTRPFLALPKGGFQVGKFYRMKIVKTLSGEGGVPLDDDLVGFYQGPDTLRVTEIACGYYRCTSVDNWRVSFNNPVDEAGVRGCLRFEPNLGVGQIDVEGYSVVVHPAGDPVVGKDYTLVVSTRCTDRLGTRLTAEHRETIAVQQPAAALKMPVGVGYVTPADEGTPLLLRLGAAHTGQLSVGKKKIERAQLAEFLADNLDTWGGLSLDGVSVDDVAQITPAAASEHTMIDVGVPLDETLGGKRTGVVFVHIATERDGYDDNPSERKALLQVTDLGISAKSSPQDVTVFVTSLTRHAPVVGAKVELVNAKGAVIWTGSTGDDGAAQGPGFSNAWDERSDEDPRIVIVSSGDDYAFLDLADWATKTETYRFNIPFAWSAQADRLLGIAFTERGVYRAGETVHMKGFVRLDRGKALEPMTGSLSLKVTDPVGDAVVTRDVTIGKYGDFELDLPLGEDAPLGTYQILVEPSEGEEAGVIKATGNVRADFRVEAYRANTFEVTVQEAHRDGDKLVARVQGRYYYGAPMGGASVQWWASRAEASFAAKGFEGFTFDARDRWDYWWEPEGTSTAEVGRGSAKLDDQGFATLEIPLGEIDLSTGPQRIDLEAEVTDVDQQTATGRAGVRVESADVYTGVSLATSFAGTSETIAGSVIALAAADGKPVEGVTMKVRWLRRLWSHERYEAAGGGSDTSNTTNELEVQALDVTSAASPVPVSFQPPVAGLYYLEVSATDAKGKTTKARDHVWVWGDGASWQADESIVQLIPEKDAYGPGETARIIIQSPFLEAKALVTVEKSGVIWKRVLDVKGTAPVLEIPITGDMQPNAYVGVILLGHKTVGTAQIQIPESRVGYTRFSVSTDDKRLAVSVAGERDSYLPGEKVKTTIKLADHQGKPLSGLVTFMAVDEGVLSLTGYKTPDPHAKFFAERPLAVSTADSRKRVWAKMTPLEDGMKSDWGGDGDSGEATNYRRAFATTAAFLPDVEVGPSGTAELEFELPDNLTTFRLMAVAATTDGRFGRAESKVEVKKPLLVRPGLPRFLSAGDEFEARATVQAVDPALAGPVEVSITTAGPIELAGPVTQTVQLTPGRALPVTFKAIAKSPGTARIGFRVRSPASGQGGKDADAVEIDVPIQWPSVVRRASLTGQVAKSATRVEHPLQIPDFVREDVGGLTVTLYSSQLSELIPSLHYLMTYPYGCVEQTTGGTLPLVALRELMGDFALPGIDNKTVLARAQAGLDRIRTMQTWSGGIAYWPGESNPHPWGSVYAGMALVKASKMPGLNVPAASIERLVGYLKTILRGQAAAGHSEWLEEIDAVKPFAAYVLALAGASEPSYHTTMFEQRASLPDFGKVLLAMAVHESKGDAKMADTLLDEVIKTVREDGDRASIKRSNDARYYWSTMDSDLRTTALLLMALSDIRPTSPLVAKLAKGVLAERKNGEWVSTQENAFAAISLGRYFTQAEKSPGTWQATVRIGDRVWLQAELTGTKLEPATITLPMDEARKATGQKLSITREGDRGPIFYTLGFAYAPKEIPKVPYDKGFTIERSIVYAAGPKAGQPVTDVVAGDLVKVDLTIRTPEVRRYVAVDDPLPAALEPVTLDFATTAKAYATAIGERKSDDEWYWDEPVTFNHVEQKDDRVTLFADYMDEGEHTHSYLARATTTGKFFGPAPRVHEMYHPDVAGQGAGYELVVN
ncbi:MAG: hypothetical protein IT385_18515 [Deltaproteobacteria bacterium]|nr:hypothetical protein [Deltaproteobacteria bacterium]